MNAAARAEITTPRFVKLLAMFCALVGELFVTGYFYNSDSTSVSQAIIGQAMIYGIAATLLMIPLKIIAAMFLTGASLMNEMTRDEIMSIEKKEPVYRGIGICLGFAWIGGCLYGIMMFIISFTEFSLNSWMVTYVISFGLEALIVSQLKILLKVTIGFALMKLTRLRCFLTLSGACVGVLINWIIQLI